MPRDPRVYKQLRRGENPEDFRRKVVPMVRRNALPPIIDSRTSNIEKSDGSRVDVESEESMLYFRSRRQTLDMIEVPFIDDGPPNIYFLMSAPPVHLEVVNEDDNGTIWLAVDGALYQGINPVTPPPTTNVANRLIEIEPATRFVIEDMAIIQKLDAPAAALLRNNFMPNGFMAALFFDLVNTPGILRAYFQQTQNRMIVLAA